MFSCLLLTFVASAIAAPLLGNTAAGPVVTINNGTVIGSSDGIVDSFKGIPFALPPTGTLRLKAPQTINVPFGVITATGTPTACPQFQTMTNTTSLPDQTLNLLSNSPLLQVSTPSGENCLTLNVQRPANANANSKLPVVFWIYGGGFEFGSTQTYDASSFIEKSISLGQNVIYVATNYRLGGFGFLAGKELQRDGSTNLGLRDQRLAMQWVQENIAAFGGDPTQVTIWGESAGSISVCDHTVINGGDNSYQGGSLFRAAIMDSGTVVPADTVTSSKAQTVYNSVVSVAGCSGASDTLACLRTVPYATFLNAANSVPGIFSYAAVDLAYLPRPDPASNFFSLSPEISVANGAFTKVPIIVGDQEDEGTLFSLTQSNISTTADLINYLSTYFLDASQSDISGLVALYPDDPTAGSPFNTGLANEVYPQFKRVAAILGDLTFTLTRRSYLNLVSAQVAAHSYISSYFYGTPVLGTFHASDILAVYDGIASPVAVQSIQTYYISFINSLDPNTLDAVNVTELITWPQWNSATKSVMNFQTAANVIITDTFREAAYEYIASHPGVFRV